MFFFPLVIPPNRLSGEVWNSATQPQVCSKTPAFWIPAGAGMTVRRDPFCPPPAQPELRPKSRVSIYRTCRRIGQWSNSSRNGSTGSPRAVSQSGWQKIIGQPRAWRDKNPRLQKAISPAHMPIVFPAKAGIQVICRRTSQNHQYLWFPAQVGIYKLIAGFTLSHFVVSLSDCGLYLDQPTSPQT